MKLVVPSRETSTSDGMYLRVEDAPDNNLHSAVTTLTPKFVTVHVVGEIDLASVDAIETAIGDATRYRKHLRVDLPSVTFMDSTGYFALSETAERAQTITQNPVEFVDASPAVTRFLMFVKAAALT